MVFLELGLPRLSSEGKGAVALELLSGISGLSDPPSSRHQVAVVHRLLDLIDFVPSSQAQDAAQGAQHLCSSHRAARAMKPRTPGMLKAPSVLVVSAGEAGATPALSLSPADKEFWGNLFLDVLLVPNATRLRPPVSGQSGGAAPAVGSLPGMTREAVERLASHPTRWQSQADLAKAS
jgi:hypothetical protein